jgi:hypothetical protein
MSERVKQIQSAMTGRKAAAVDDNALREAVRSKLVEIAQETGRPLDPASLSGITAAVLRSAAKTIIYEAEVVVALEMGAAGELEHEGATLNQTNCSSWIVAYSCCGDRKAAIESSRLGSARDRARVVAVAAEERSRTFAREGLLNAWRSFVEAGAWEFSMGFGAVLYDRIGVEAVRALLDAEQLEKARRAALSGVRRDYPHKYKSSPDPEVEKADIFKMYAKAQLCRAYFEALRAKSLDITFNPLEK